MYGSDRDTSHGTQIIWAKPNSEFFRCIDETVGNILRSFISSSRRRCWRLCASGIYRKKNWAHKKLCMCCLFTGNGNLKLPFFVFLRLSFLRFILWLEQYHHAQTMHCATWANRYILLLVPPFIILVFFFSFTMLVCSIPDTWSLRDALTRHPILHFTSAFASIIMIIKRFDM